MSNGLILNYIICFLEIFRAGAVRLETNACQNCMRNEQKNMQRESDRSKVTFTLGTFKQS